MNQRRRFTITLIIELLLVWAFAMWLPSVLMKDDYVLLQTFIWLVLSLLLVYNHYNSLLAKVEAIIQAYQIKGYEGKRSILKAYRTLMTAFIEGQNTAVRYRKINRTLSLAIEVNNNLIKSRDVDNIYEYILNMAIKAMDRSDKGSVMLLNGERELEFVALIGFDGSFFDIRIPEKDAFLYVLTDGKCDCSVIVDSVVEFNRSNMSDEEFYHFYEKYPLDYQTTLTCPIRVEDKFIGVINLDSHDEEGFNDEDLAIMDLFASQLEISIRNHRLVNRILYLSRYDKLTGVYNRSYYEEVVGEWISSSHTEFSMVVIDMNNLKKVNDLFGHLEGDRLLKIFSEEMKNQLKVTDHFSRIGGDEFIILVKNDSQLAIQAVMDKVTLNIEQHAIERKLPYSITFSFGISGFPQDGQSADDLYVVADERMYKMKKRYKAE
jgi:diguanylate cyclase (GGDEF)-like protein